MKQVLSVIALIIFIAVQACGQAQQNQRFSSEQIQEAKNNLVLLNNQEQIIPLKSLQDLKIASVTFDFQEVALLDSILAKYHSIHRENGNAFLNDLNGLEDDLKFYNLIIITLTNKSLSQPQLLNFITDLATKKTLIINFLGDGALLSKLDSIKQPILWSNQVNAATAFVAAQAIFGGLSISAKLKENYGNQFKLNDGFETQAIRLGFALPEELGLQTKDFENIDAIAEEAIQKKAAPGAVVLVAKNGKIIYNKAYGKHTYQSETLMGVDDIFDLASITKIAATTVAAMKLQEEGKLNLDAPLANYIARTRRTNKANIKVKDVMLHQAGFVPFIPFYKDIEKNAFSRIADENYTVKVADSFYLNTNYYRDVMWKQMLASPLKTPGKYVYSDLSMYFMKEIIENITQQPIPNYVSQNFYNKLGLETMVFNPRDKFKKGQIVPTEIDNYFRKTLLWGYVHDQGAAMAGGVAGHAGLFSNATDLAILMQMLLNKGSYGGEQFLKPETVELFTQQQSPLSRRGLGFDRKDPDLSKKYPSALASQETFGHTGYTGTCVWVDPANQLIYIFLSNRVHPQVNNKLIDLNIRSRIHDEIYKAISKTK
ncbi:serine hydrolase domain-containing protein [Pedobacter puniceum]|uniref:Serine hydrolase n=1 Tax=Pedobacter puniceum TaxID=2666136 RepID=A0A7K0FQ32_9SPHI|nr:serine hydrolase [Pedobacter puniceum]MRX47983.1 serine hydrolase [Pedobacter puniceum]